MARAVRRTLFALALLALGLSGCGIPIDAAAHPFPNVTEPGPNVASGPQTVTIYFVHSGKLVPVERKVFALSIPNALAVLAGGPSTAEEEQGIENFIDPLAVVMVGTVQKQVVTVRIDGTFLSLPSALLSFAYGQVVYTLTSAGLGVAAVQFVIGDNNIPWSLVYLPDGSAATTGRVNRLDYCSVSSSGCAGVEP
jgi:hypothetical protein